VLSLTRDRSALHEWLTECGRSEKSFVNDQVNTDGADITSTGTGIGIGIGADTAASTATSETGASAAGRPKRADARRNQETLLDAAAAIFVESGVEAPVRDIAAKAGVGMGTIYRHFPTRADLIIAVYRHQVEALAEAGPALLADSDSAYAALVSWIDQFVDFLVTKHGLAAVLHSDNADFEALHTYFIERLVPVAARILAAAVADGEIRSGIGAIELMRGVGNLCIGADRADGRFDPRRMIALLIEGLRAR
jgi:AcrR family transcriptional regulator